MEGKGRGSGLQEDHELLVTIVLTLPVLQVSMATANCHYIHMYSMYLHST
jgi:hypothetical protein